MNITFYKNVVCSGKGGVSIMDTFCKVSQNGVGIRYGIYKYR